MALIPWWQEISSAVKWSKLHSFECWSETQIILHSTSQCSAICWSDRKLVRKGKEARLRAQYGTLYRDFPRLQRVLVKIWQFIPSLPYFLKWKSVRAHHFHFFRPRSILSGPASWDDCGWVFPDELCVSLFSLIGSHTMLELRVRLFALIGSHTMVGQ